MEITIKGNPEEITKLLQTIASSQEQSTPYSDDLNKKGNYNPLLFKTPIERKTPKYSL